MFENLRKQPNADKSFQAESAFSEERGFDTATARPSSRGLFLGMTPPQRLIVAVMMMIAVCVLGTLCLLLTGRIGFI